MRRSTMANCHKCGREIPRRTGVYKVIKTGSYSGGGDYFRNVNLCPKCAESMATEAEGKQKKKTLLLVVGGLVVVAIIYYFFFMNR
jgi:hypothetical protein